MKLLEYARLALAHRQDPLFVHYLKGRRVLDIGCGRGEFLRRDPARFAGVDLDASLVAQCRSQGLDAQSMSALDLKFADATFEAVHAAQLIEHLAPPDAQRLLVEAARVVKPGGVVFLTTPGVRNVWNTFSHIRPYPPAAFIKLLSSETEGYIRDGAISLVLERAYGTRSYHANKALMLASSLLDLAFPPRDPIGWTIVLRKPPAHPK